MLLDLEVDGMKCESIVHIMEDIKEALILEGYSVKIKDWQKIDCEAPTCVVDYPDSRVGTWVKGVWHEMKLLKDEPARSEFQFCWQVGRARHNSKVWEPVCFTGGYYSQNLRLRLRKAKFRHSCRLVSYAKLERGSKSCLKREHRFNLRREEWILACVYEKRGYREGSIYGTHYESRFMAFGLVKKPKTFHRLTNEVIQCLNKIEGKWYIPAYVDDLMVFSDSPEEHEKHIRRMMQKLE